MNDRLISAEKLVERLGEQWCDECMTDDCYYCNIYQIKEIIRNMPTVDAERHGKWVIDRGEMVMHCDSCGWVYEYYDGLEEEWTYCPHCGAKMDAPTQKSVGNALEALDEVREDAEVHS